MANNQPLNTDISVKNRVRGQRQQLFVYGSVKDIANRMRPLVMSVVGREWVIGSKRDSTAGITATSLINGRGTGLPIVRYIKPVLDFADAVNTMQAADDCDFPVQIGQDKFLQSVDGSEGDDLQALERAVSGAPNTDR